MLNCRRCYSFRDFLLRVKDISSFYHRNHGHLIRLKWRGTTISNLRIIMKVTFNGCWSTTAATVGGSALASSLTSSSITNWPSLKSSNSCFSTSGFKRLFLMRILRFSILGGGSGTPGSSYFSDTPKKSAFKMICSKKPQNFAWSIYCKCELIQEILFKRLLYFVFICYNLS